ncbi:MAG: WavE lipopolysaccharide synthesis family protein [Proteobacteria bacterium]|nr:WavE lipopolysaccharide synthesis family protein [Pseudomonadota bacterium]MBU1708656.1 WavE lipopolysaccharide synthesis family protein [Pseudomonadota bacterium]
MFKKIIQEKNRAVSRLSLKIIKRFLKGVRSEDNEALISAMAEVFHARHKQFATFHFRPESSSEIATWSDQNASTRRLGIVLQGPLLKTDDFTFETVKLYRKHFPDTVIIISTWEAEDPVILKNLEALGAVVVTSRTPENPGPSHINFQIVSSLAGVKKAKELDLQYVLKSRTDQRFYMPNVDVFLINMLQNFPATGNYRQEQRILGLSLNTFKYRMYGISDMFIFGTVADMLNYWDCPHDRRPPSGVSERTMYDHARAAICEVYLATQYLQKIGFDLKWTLADSWKAFAESFVIIDRENIDLYWPKYSKMEYWHQAYDHIRTDRELSFREWLNLYSNLGEITVTDKHLQLNLQDILPPE